MDVHISMDAGLSHFVYLLLCQKIGYFTTATHLNTRCSLSEKKYNEYCDVAWWIFLAISFLNLENDLRD